MNQSARGLTIYYCGHEQCSPGHFFGPAVRKHYLLHVVLKGKGIYRTSDREYRIAKGEAFLIKPQEVTYYRADSREPWEYAWDASVFCRCFQKTEGESPLRYRKGIRETNSGM